MLFNLGQFCLNNFLYGIRVFGVLLPLIAEGRKKQPKALMFNKPDSLRLESATDPEKQNNNLKINRNLITSFLFSSFGIKSSPESKRTPNNPIKFEWSQFICVQYCMKPAG